MIAACWRVAYIKNMSENKVTLKWERGGAEFSYQKYPRDHTWSFDGGQSLAYLVGIVIRLAIAASFNFGFSVFSIL